MRYLRNALAILMVLVSFPLLLLSLSYAIRWPAGMAACEALLNWLSRSGALSLCEILRYCIFKFDPTLLLAIGIFFFSFACWISRWAIRSHWRDTGRWTWEMEGEALLARGRKHRALKAFLRAGRLDRAAEIHVSLGDPREAARLYETLGGELGALAPDHYQAAGDTLGERRSARKAAEYFQSIHDLERAGGFFARSGEDALALQCFERQFESFRESAPRAQWPPKCVRIAELAEKTGAIETAAAYYELAGDLGSAVEKYMAAGCFIRAAELLKDAEDVSGALEAILRIDPGHPDFHEGLRLKGELLFARGDYSEAIKSFMPYFKVVRPSEHNLEGFFTLGLALEKIGKLKQARDVFVRVHALKPFFQNVDVRIEAIDQKHEEPQAMSELLARDSEFRQQVAGDAILLKVGERYTDLEELGRGGAGIVYRARDLLLDRFVAMKQLPENVSSDPSRMQGFFREAKAVAKLNHPNIVAVYDIMKAENRYYIVMEYVDGVSVERLLEAQDQLSLRLAVYIARSVLVALSYAHRHGVIHQDIKPANIMLAEDKSVKLMDFGIAQLRGDLPNYSTDVVVGTPKYISPEQLLGVPVDERADIYSFGVTFYEMVTGALPFPLEGILRHHLATPPDSPRTYNPYIPHNLEKTILRCLAKNREERYPSAKALLADLKDVAQHVEQGRRKEDI